MCVHADREVVLSHFTQLCTDIKLLLKRTNKISESHVNVTVSLVHVSVVGTVLCHDVEAGILHTDLQTAAAQVVDHILPFHAVITMTSPAPELVFLFFYSLLC